MTAEAIRQTLRRLYQGSCGYCGVHESEAASELEIDHFQPRSADGSSELENLVCCCTTCNRPKGDFWASLDATRRLLHPHREDVAAHLRLGPDGLMVALTETGVFHLERLHLNRPPLVALRRRRSEVTLLQARIAAVETEQAETQQRISALEQGLQQALEKIDRLSSP